MCRQAGKPLTRRSATLGLVAAATSAAVPSDFALADIAPNLLPPLRRLVQGSKIKFGCAVGAPSGQLNAMLLRKVATEANIFVPEVHLKWEFTEPRPTEFDFAASDSIANFAARHDMVMHGHTLVWHEAVPATLSSGVS